MKEQICCYQLYSSKLKEMIKIMRENLQVDLPTS